jgi:valyl-tRNA synthetase
MTYRSSACTSKYEVTDLQTEYGLIQIKGVHSLYQLQVVSDNDNVKIATTRPRKWATRSALTVQPLCKK